MKPIARLKESIAVLEDENNIYQFIFTASRTIKKFQIDNLIKDILSYTKQNILLEDLESTLLKKYNANSVNNAISSLQKEGILRIQTSEVPIRFSRQIYFIDELTSSWDETMYLHNKVKKTKVSVFGVGGIGSWIVNGLDQLGIENITLVDPDIVEKSNLNRQLIYLPKDIGKFKVDVWKDRLINSKIKTYKMFVDKTTDISDIVHDSDFIFNCADSPSVQETTSIIDSYASKYSVPYCVAGGYNLHLGMVGPIIVPGETATFDDFLQYQKDHDPLKGLVKFKDVEQSGNLGPIAGAIANIQLMEAFKHIIKKGSVNYNKFAEIDFMNLNVDWRYFSK